MILSNQASCTLCGDAPYSATRHDYKTCKCGNLSVDGGMDYIRRVREDRSNTVEMSIEWEDELVRKLTQSITEALLTGRNPLGVVCSVARTLRDNGYTIQETET